MPLRRRRLPAAVADLDDIWSAIAIDSVDAAERLIGRLWDAEVRLAEFPELGRRRDELFNGLRSWPVGSYLIFYIASADAILIVRILHGARDLGGLFSTE